jgi:hypothetical protein
MAVILSELLLTVTFNVRQTWAEPQGWSQTYGGISGDSASALVQTGDGGYALAGDTYSFGVTNSSDSWLVKTNASGTAQWTKTYGGTSNDYAYSLVETSDDGYAIAGFTQSFGNGNSDFWLVKTDANGNAQWNKTYGGTNSDLAHALVHTSDDGYALVGKTESFGAGGGDFWLVKTDENGVIPEFPLRVILMALMVTVTLAAVLLKRARSSPSRPSLY